MMTSTRLVRLKETLFLMVSENKISNEDATRILNAAGLTQTGSNTWVDNNKVQYTFN